MGNYIDPTDIDNWPSGTLESEKTALIARIELQLEKMTQNFFYAKALDIRMNGNGKNRLFPFLEADIITITDVELCGISLPSDWIDWDEHSVFLNLCSSGAYAGDSWAELYYRLSSIDETGLFPRGYDNIRIQGTYGNTTLLPIAKAACIILVRYENDPTLYKALFKSEKIGDYSYTFGGVGTYGNIYTGIREADLLIDLLVNDAPTISTP